MLIKILYEHDLNLYEERYIHTLDPVLYLLRIITITYNFRTRNGGYILKEFMWELETTLPLFLNQRINFSGGERMLI